MDFNNFIDQNVEESFKRGKLELESIVEVGPLSMDMSEKGGKDRSSVGDEDENVIYNALNEPEDVQLFVSQHDRLRRRTSSVVAHRALNGDDPTS